MDRLDTVDLTRAKGICTSWRRIRCIGEFAIQIFSLEWHDYCTVGSVRHTKAAQIVQKAMQAPSFDVRTIARVTNSVAKQCESDEQLDMKIAKAVVAFTKAVVYCHQTQTRRTLDGSALNQAEEDVVGVCRDDIDVMKYATGVRPETGNYRLKQSAQMVISTCTRWRRLFNIRTSEEVVSIQLTSREARWQTNVADAITRREWL